MEHNRWWRDCVGYVIYPQAYMDSNDDGIGDIQGILSKLDYLRDLGINLIWLCPIFASPMEDNGYDVKDFYAIAPEFGSMDDLKRLITECHNRGIRLILDLPLNQTSDEHPWFEMAIRDESSAERGYYFFRKGRREGDKLLPPNNWMGYNSISVWSNIEGTDDFYFHLFAAKQPDLNWANPIVRDEMSKVAKFYLDMGVDGFRIDAMAHLSKDLSFSDSTLPTDSRGLVLDPPKFSNRPEVYQYLEEFRQKSGHPEACFIGEAGGGISPEQAAHLADREHGPITMVFNFDTSWNNNGWGGVERRDEDVRTDVILLKNNFMRWYSLCNERADMPLYWVNHDHPRLISQYGSTLYRNESAKCLLTTLLFLYGTPFIYYGDEIGMSNVTYRKPEDFFSDSAQRSEIAWLREQGYSDERIVHYLNRASRVNARTPMQWDRGPFAGFSKKGSVNKVNDNYLQGINVYDQMRDPWSILNFFQYAIWKRRDPYINSIVNDGPLEILDHSHPDVFAYVHHGNEKLIVVSNFREYDVDFPFYWEIEDVLLHNYDSVLLHDHVFHLRPFESYLLKPRGHK